MDLPESVLTWTCEDARKWLLKMGHARYVQVMCDTHRIDGLGLLTLTEDDLKKPPLEFRVLGDIKRLAFDLSCLRASHPSDMGKINFSPNRSVQYPVEDSLCNLVLLKAGADGVVSNDESWMFESKRSNSPESHISDFFGSDPFILSPADDSPASKGMARNLEPEVWKAVLSFCYFLTATIITSMVMVIVHDRVPDMKKYPPLPDIFLDSVPLIPWAFYMCEVTGCLLSVIWILVLTFHKHRFILMRRFFALSGSVFLLRCITMLITSLSVPGAHLECSPRPYGDVWAKLGQALLIWQGFGMSVRGVRTCGDYMFSGHTVVLTMLNFFITEYTPRRLYFLHTLSWVLNVFGVFFILAAHEHYSIDVFVAFYITSRLFLYYHTLANSSALRQRDRHRAKIWFPLFSFFEARVDGMVPNEYELPWARISLEPIRSLFSVGRNVNSSPLHHTSATTNGKKTKKRK